jgi:hypothetical protein
LRDSRPATVLKEVEKQPLPSTPPSPEKGPGSPVTFKLHVRVTAGFAHRLPAATAIKLASRQTRLIHASDASMRLRFLAMVQFRLVPNQIQDDFHDSPLALIVLSVNGKLI